MISILTAFFLVHGEADWGWWLAWVIAFWYEVVIKIIIPFAKAAK